MDPDVAYETMVDERVANEDRANAATDLLLWLYGGGFTPKAWTGSTDKLRELCQKIRQLRPPPRSPLARR